MKRGASSRLTIRRPFSPMLYPQKSSPESCLLAISSSVGAVPSTRATRVSPRKQRAYVDLPKQIVKTLRGMRKNSTVLASAKEFGGLLHTGPLESTKDFSSKAFGSTMVELMLVKILNSSAQRTS